MESRPFLANLDYPFSPPTFNQDSTLHELIFPHLGGETNYSTLTTPTSPPPVKETTQPPPVISRKRLTRKDRHSKIVTAQGMRDRRMRLNLEVAPQFFDIQDMLGYDKASKTVQWLMKEAKESIDKLKAATRPKDSSLSCGASSKSTEVSTLEVEFEDISAVVSDDKGKSSVSQQEINVTPKTKRRGHHPSRRASYPSSLDRESRARARARARERTSEKKNNNALNQLSFYNSVQIDGMDEQSGSHDLKSSLDLIADQVEEQCSPSTNQSSQMVSGGRVSELPVSILDYSNTNLFILAEQWMSQFDSIQDGLPNRLW